MYKLTDYGTGGLGEAIEANEPDDPNPDVRRVTPLVAASDWGEADRETAPMVDLAKPTTRCGGSRGLIVNDARDELAPRAEADDDDRPPDDEGDGATSSTSMPASGEADALFGRCELSTLLNEGDRPSASGRV